MATYTTHKNIPRKKLSLPGQLKSLREEEICLQNREIQVIKNQKKMDLPPPRRNTVETGVRSLQFKSTPKIENEMEMEMEMEMEIEIVS